MAIHPIAGEMAIKKHKCQPAGGARGKARGSTKSAGKIIWEP